jgi:galactokinase
MTDTLIDRPELHDQRIETLILRFKGEFGRPPEGIAEAPGRVNLIGEHTDYNDGLVLPFAIDRSVLCAWGLKPLTPGLETIGPGMSFRSLDEIPGTEYFGGIDTTLKTGNWLDYPSGVFWLIDAVSGQQSTAVSQGQLGLSCLFTGNIPIGSGLSSSAAIEVATAGSFRSAYELSLNDADLAQLCQRAENEYVGVQCGIMDQFASALSKRDHALLIDCRTLAYKHVPLQLEEHGMAIVIANSAVRRELITSAYNDRRRECEEAVVRLRDLLGRHSLHSLRDVRMAEIDGLEIHTDDIPLRRARHVVSEIDRVAEAVDALEHNDFTRLGELMVQSHLSLKTDYAVSSEQLDLLVGLATAQEYVLGARLTGAGFGGCTVNLIRADRVDDFASDVIVPYRARTGLPAVIYVTPACDGLRTWRL